MLTMLWLSLNFSFSNLQTATFFIQAVTFTYATTTFSSNVNVAAVSQSTFFRILEILLFFFKLSFG